MGNYLEGFIIATGIFTLTQVLKWLLRRPIAIPKGYGYKKKPTRLFW